LGIYLLLDSWKNKELNQPYFNLKQELHVDTAKWKFKGNINPHMEINSEVA
jgi:hypothetical protein